MFKNRTEAGQKLAQKLETYRGQEAVVLALPRGGVVLGYEVARALSFPLDIIATRKVGHPNNPEYAIGVVDENDMNILNETETLSINRQWLEEEIAKQKAEAKRRSLLYRKGKKPLDLAGKVVIIVDDGIATGFTMRLAARIAKKQQPKKIITAVPVAPSDSIRELKKEGADEVIILEKPEQFRGAVGAHYQEFEQVDDEEVIRLLHSVE
ncbi:MAG: hypothetical protein A3G05_01940 [Candidatus Zambryskibacteria bacterium RIFCSPLOWO2_12_FULL_45_14]|uniref:Phosphoribosyltransferase domain-containing protein n=2 Tax=Candidatus Zambryskiibacteriota TaxID=1817925 RepID=A0A1G2ULC4_9BACT|nr:MAG: hypothetical protein A3H60_01840 [Candidatus Zambryskibacteria bacterium RIFCSPLOWO2_02_FULL_44_12b]OHB14112.1 MAG: hypothetical protein A3G05_01940 [Candidatus Zambryskibacteria bacterium RIFCSPLOWO2_12_FULL_45_14]